MGHALQDDVGLMRVSTQLKYLWNLPKSQLSTMEQLSTQCSEEMDHALQDGLGLLRVSQQLKYFWKLPKSPPIERATWKFQRSGESPHKQDSRYFSRESWGSLGTEKGLVSRSPS